MPRIGMYRATSRLHFIERGDIVQCPIHQQFSHYNQLLDRQCDVATRTLQLTGQVSAHDVERGEGFTGVGEQGGGVDIGADCENVADGIEAVGIAQACADGGFGDVCETG